MKPLMVVLSLLSLVGCTQRKETAAPDIVAALSAGRYRLIDLSHEYFEGMPALVLPPSAPQMPPFQLHNISRWGPNGSPAAYWNWFQAGEHMGTHVDAPNHWFSGKDFEPVDRITLTKLFCPAVVIDVSASATNNPDYMVTVDDLLRWEQQHGQVPKGAMVIMNSGWSKKFEDSKAFLGTGADKISHNPGFSPEAARWLMQSRDINGIAVDSISTDALAVAGKTSPPLQVHIELHRAGKYQIEMITNPDQLPATGAYLIVAPIKVRGGSGAPARIYGIAPLGG